MDADHPAPVLLLLVEVREQLVEVGLVVPKGEPREGRPPSPGDGAGVGAAVRELVQDAVDRDREEIVPVGEGRQALEHPEREALLTRLLEQVAHQQVRVDPVGVGRDAPAVDLEGLLPHPRQREHARLELGRHGVGLELTEPREHAPRLLGLAPLHHAHRELAEVLGLALGIELDQAPDRLLVGEVVVGREVDPSLLLQGGPLAAPRVAEELVDDLGRGDGVADLGVEPHEERALLLVGLAREHGLLQLDGEVREGAEPRGHRHQAVLDVAPARQGLDPPPQIAPGTLRLLLLAHLAVEPGQTHLEVLTRLAVGARALHGLEDADGVLQCAHLLEGLGELESRGRTRIRDGLHATQHLEGLGHPPRVTLHLEEEQLGRHLGDLELLAAQAPGAGALAEPHTGEGPGPLQQVPGLGGLLEALPGGERSVPVALLEQHPRESTPPQDARRLGAHQLGIGREHRVASSGLAVHLEELEPHLGLDVLTRGRLQPGDGLVEACRLPQDLVPGLLVLHAGLLEPREALEHGVKGAGGDVSLDAEGEGLAALPPERGDERGLPGGARRLLGLTRAQLPARDPQQVPRTELRLLPRLEQAQRIRRAVEQGEDDRGPVAILGPQGLGEGPQGVLPLRALGVHREERARDPELELQSGVGHAVEGEVVRGLGGLDLPQRIEQARVADPGLERGGVCLERGLEGLLRRLQGAQAPARVAKERRGCGPTRRDVAHLVRDQALQPLLERREGAVLRDAGTKELVRDQGSRRLQRGLQLRRVLRRQGCGEDGREEERGGDHAATPVLDSSGRRRR